MTTSHTTDDFELSDTNAEIDLNDDISNFENVGSENYFSKSVTNKKYFVGDFNQTKVDDVSVVCAGFEACSLDYSIERDGFAYNTVEFLSSGSIELRYDDKVLNLSAPAIFTYSQKSKFSIKVTSDVPVQKYFINFIGDKSQDLLSNVGVDVGTPINITHFGMLANLFSQVIECTSYSIEVAEEITRHLLKSIFIIIKEDLKTSDLILNQSYLAFLKSKNFIESNYLTMNSIQEIANICKVSETYMCRIFKRYFYMSPYGYLVSRKMSHAADLMVRENYSVKLAGFTVGFQDPYHFSRVFKKTYGIPPKNFGKNKKHQSEKL